MFNYDMIIELYYKIVLFFIKMLTERLTKHYLTFFVYLIKMDFMFQRVISR